MAAVKMRLRYDTGCRHYGTIREHNEQVVRELRRALHASLGHIKADITPRVVRQPMPLLQSLWRMDATESCSAAR